MCFHRLYLNPQKCCSLRNVGPHFTTIANRVTKVENHLPTEPLQLCTGQGEYENERKGKWKQNTHSVNKALEEPLGGVNPT